ncbi:MAG: cytochrome b/b6 domain-containing protein [Proteobacteria bacterium]|nr:cytochrome b/b6 domain-containing protein [Pseudomonadota bacterium]
MTRHFVWDIFVRIFHWTLVVLFAANALYTNPEHSLHHYIGYAVAALILARIIWGFVGTRHARFRDFLPSVSGAIRQLREMLTGQRKVHLGHTPLGALMIYNLLVTLAAIATTGYMMTTVRFFGVQWVEDTHVALVTWAEISVAIHVAAVLIESRRLRVNLPKAMISGYKETTGPL